MIKLSTLVLLLLASNFHLSAQESTEEYWKLISNVVSEGDFDGYAATYHPDAVLVNGISGRSYPISNALAGWKQGFEDTKSGKLKASVEFRFSEKFKSESTSLETGIFKYESQSGNDEQQVVYLHFQGLLVKKEGGWKLMMEYQISMATEEEWNGLE